MRTYALTYPQLMGQLLDLDWSEADLVATRRAWDEAARMTRGLLRPSGSPFSSHLVRTASIAAQSTNDPTLVRAALLHAWFSLGGSGGFLAKSRRCAPRDALRAVAGREVEEILVAYDALAWSDEGALRTHLESHAGYAATKRSALLLRIMNELEDHLDAAMRFHADGGATAGPSTALAAKLARALGYAELGDEVEDAIEAARKRSVPASVRTGRSLAYHPSRTRVPELAGLRRALRALLRGLRHRGA